MLKAVAAVVHKNDALYMIKFYCVSIANFIVNLRSTEVDFRWHMDVSIYSVVVVWF